MTIIDEFNESVSNQVAINIDNAIIKFLNEQGYQIDSSRNLVRMQEIVQELKEMNLFVDFVEFTLPYKLDSESCINVTSIIIPFFNYISNPLDKSEMIKTLQEMYDRGELDYARN